VQIFSKYINVIFAVANQKLLTIFRSSRFISGHFDRGRTAEALRYCYSKSFHPAPVRRIHKMPSRTWTLLAVDQATWPVLGFGKKELWM
jgi:hypothetical protein